MSERKRAAGLEETRDEMGFNFGFFAILMPAMAMFAGAVCLVVQLATPHEAVISATLIGLVFVLLVNDHPLGGLVVRVLVDGTAVVVAWLAPVPVVGTVAQVVGNTIVLWFPIVMLAVVAWLL